jgi:putative DNA primase/helicase
MVLICADNDVNRTGQRAAYDAADRFVREGRRVRVAIPLEPGTDANDVLIRGVIAAAGEVRRVA